MTAKPVISCFMLGALLAVGASMWAAKPGAPNAKTSSRATAKSHDKTNVDSEQDEGERVFAQNCSRCHNAPEGFSSRIAGTVTKHMRVRANLSAEEERAVLHFFNP